MKKAEELKLYAPEPKRPELDAALCMSVAEGQGMGRYIEGKVLTVAVWDKKEKPLVVWRFFGDYWTGELRGNENPTKGELSPRQIEGKPCQCLTWRTEVPATKGESELLQNYFDDCRPGYLIGIVEDALSAHARKKREERNARQAAETKKLFENLPEPPEDLSKQVLKVCSDAGFLWVTNDKQNVIEPGGVEKKISIQRARCDSCGGEYTLSELLKHKSTATCECCGEKMQVRNTRYSVKRLWAARTFLWSKPQGDGVWIRRYLVYFDFRNHRAEPEFHGRGIWWTDGKTIKQWKRDWGEKAQYIMCQRPKLSAMLLAPSGPYQPYTLASHTDQFESDVRKVLKSEWMYQYDNHLNFPWEVRQWEIVNRYPMAESLVKTGWADALCSQVYDEYEHSTRINLRAETYYGVFGLNRQELAAVSQSKKSFCEVDNALEWKEAGLAINGKNMAMTANIRKLSGIVSLLYSDVEGVTFAAGYQNDNDEKDAAGRPPHCIEIIVQGGLDEDVSDIIWKNKPGGIRAYGSHYAYATDINGIRQYVEFTRVKDVYLLLSVKVTSNDELDADFETRIKSLLMAENLLVGSPIRLQKFIRPIIENVSGVDYIEIRGILSEKQDIEDVEDGAMLTGAVPVSISQQPVVTMDGIRVVKA